VGSGRRGFRLGWLLPAAIVVLFLGLMVVRQMMVKASFNAPTVHTTGGVPGGSSSAKTPLSLTAKRTPLSPTAKASKSVPGPVGIPGKWNLILNSTFSGKTLDTNIWRPGWFGTGISGPINANEVACYNSANVSLPGDDSVHLAVTATASRCERKTRPYTGAVLMTDPKDGRRSGGFTYRYGALQALVYIPADGQAIADWPAVLTLGQHWPTDGEDDVMENLGGIVCAHFHSPGFAPGGPLGACDPGFRPGWHTVSSNWEPGQVTWYYDGIQIAHITEGVTSQPMYLVLVNTVSGKSLAVAKPDVERVAYVRVWQEAK
jgi:beta-glucanase (GH16 family)